MQNAGVVLSRIPSVDCDHVLLRWSAQQLWHVDEGRTDEAIGPSGRITLLRVEDFEGEFSAGARVDGAGRKGAVIPGRNLIYGRCGVCYFVLFFWLSKLLLYVTNATF